ncbi:MAG: hypothetical protein JXA01_00130 [Dehalococcoidia bacterium]|nr:hypothetical protein [Dehalococcoidia bacterium]
MSLPLIFAVFCGVFVAAVLGLVMWLIFSNLKELKRDKKCESATESNERR